MSNFRCLSLTQPWAQLVIEGHKKFETRSWKTPYRGVLGIHASKGFPRDCQELLGEEPFLTSLNRPPEELARGEILGIVRLVDCSPTSQMFQHPEPEYSFGDFSLGRYEWKLENPTLLNLGIPCKGALGLWSLPPEIERQILEDIRQ